jgi:predicted NodU family carbamoyl transferase
VTTILGISAYYQDSAAALITEDKILEAAQEERFSCKKQDTHFPGNAISYCLSEAGQQVTLTADLLVGPVGVGDACEFSLALVPEPLAARVLILRGLERWRGNTH